jgi:hypothetical protein
MAIASPKKWTFHIVHCARFLGGLWVLGTRYLFLLGVERSVRGSAVEIFGEDRRLYAVMSAGILGPLALPVDQSLCGRVARRSPATFLRVGGVETHQGQAGRENGATNGPEWIFHELSL